MIFENSYCVQALRRVTFVAFLLSCAIIKMILLRKSVPTASLALLQIGPQVRASDRRTRK
jgi:hypothetical protein